jgi:hypothetical protein
MSLILGKVMDLQKKVMRKIMDKTTGNSHS